MTESDLIIEVKEKIREKLKNKGLNESQIEITLMKIDTDFLTHAYVNGIFLNDESNEERLKFYLRYLKDVLKA